MSHKHIYLYHVSNQCLIRCFLLLGGFFKKHARDTSMAKASLGAFPPIIFAPRNAKRKLAVDFNKASRIYFHAQIYQCFDDFNRTQGTTVTLQNGTRMLMAKAIILAIYCDHPACVKCCLVGSACPQCLTRRSDMGRPPESGIMEMRTPAIVALKRTVILHTLTDTH